MSSTLFYESDRFFDLLRDKNLLQEFSKDQPICRTTKFVIDLGASPIGHVGTLDIQTLLASSWTRDVLTAHASPHGCQIQDDGFYVADENPNDAGGALALNSHNGDLSVSNTTDSGEVFNLVHRRWIVNAASAIKGEVISFQSSTNPDLYLALDKNDSVVKGLTLAEMHHISNSYWRRVSFQTIGPSPSGSGYFALQYWGNEFGPPNYKEYYFVIEDKTTFKIASVKEASKHGRLGLIPF